MEMREEVGLDELKSADRVLYTIRDNRYAGLNYLCGDTLVIDTKTAPNAGDLTMLTDGSRKELIWLLGETPLGYRYISTQYIKYPLVKELYPNDKCHYIGKVIECIRMKAV